MVGRVRKMNMNGLVGVVVMVSFLALCVAGNESDNPYESDNPFDPPPESDWMEFSSIEEACSETEELKNVCISVVNSNPHEDLKSNMTGLLLLFINQTLYAVVDDYSYFRNESLNNPQFLNDRTITDCMQQFQMSKDTLQVLLKLRGNQLHPKINKDLDFQFARIANFFNLCELYFYSEEFGFPSGDWTQALEARLEYVKSLLVLSTRIKNIIKCGSIKPC